MKKTEAVSLGDILKLYIEMDGNGDEFDRRKIEFVWSEVVGPVINRATTRRHVEGDTLHVYISSAPLKSELAFMAEPLVKALNNAVGKEVINKVVIH